jgi:DNA-binding response OmpR family regulator
LQKILIVDDDPDIRSLYRLVLRQEGLEVIEAASGQEALSLVKTDIPALVLLDIMMPGMDGYEVCRRLRTNPRTVQVPVLLFSANGAGGVQDKVKRAGADGFVAKTAGPRAVASRIHALLIDLAPSPVGVASSGASIRR